MKKPKETLPAVKRPTKAQMLSEMTFSEGYYPKQFKRAELEALYSTSKVWTIESFDEK